MADPRGAPASATVLRNPRRPVEVLIWCECSIVRGVEVADLRGFAFLYEQSQKGRGGEGGREGPGVGTHAAGRSFGGAGGAKVNWTNEANFG